jgi:hypothetical protein
LNKRLSDLKNIAKTDLRFKETSCREVFPKRPKGKTGCPQLLLPVGVMLKGINVHGLLRATVIL